MYLVTFYGEFIKLDLQYVSTKCHSYRIIIYYSYAACGCSVIKLILKSFGPVIKSNLISPPVAGGRDLQKEERYKVHYSPTHLSCDSCCISLCRYEKCQQCHAHLASLREEAGRIVRESPGSLVGKLIRERALLTALNCLD